VLFSFTGSTSISSGILDSFCISTLSPPPPFPCFFLLKPSFPCHLQKTESFLFPLSEEVCSRSKPPPPLYRPPPLPLSSFCRVPLLSLETFPNFAGCPPRVVVPFYDVSLGPGCFFFSLRTSNLLPPLFPAREFIFFLVHFKHSPQGFNGLKVPPQIVNTGFPPYLRDLLISPPFPA